MNQTNRSNRHEISESLQSALADMVEKFDPSNLTKNLFKNSQSSTISKLPDVFGKKEEKDSKLRADLTEKGFFNSVSSGMVDRVRVGDGVATIAAKQINLLQRIEDKKRVKREITKDFSAQIQENKKQEIKKQKKEVATPSIKIPKAVKVAGGVGAGLALGAGISSMVETEKPTPTPTATPAPKVPEVNLPTATPEKELPKSEGIAKLLEKGESTNYDQLVFGKNKKDLTGKFNKKPISQMTVQEVRDLQKKMSASKEFPSTAIGKYQIVGGTLQEAIDKKIVSPSDKFDKNTQDMLFKSYLVGSKRKGISEFLSGGSDLERAQIELAMEFASVGVPRDIKKGEFGAKGPKRDIKKGQSYYEGEAGNRASITPEETSAALQFDKLAQMKTRARQQEASNAEPVKKASSGDRIASVSSDNNNSNKQQRTVSVNNPVSSVSGAQAQPQIIRVATIMDLPLFLNA